MQGHLRLILLPIVYNAMAQKPEMRSLALFHALHRAMKLSTYLPLLKNTEDPVQSKVVTRSGSGSAHPVQSKVVTRSGSGSARQRPFIQITLAKVVGGTAMSLLDRQRLAC